MPKPIMNNFMSRRAFSLATASSFLSLVLLASASHVSAGHVQPIPKNGSCPSRYTPSGGHCLPQQGATHAIEKTGSCPSGYRPSGNYCLANSEQSNLAIHKAGSCPSGFRPSGNYCLSNK